MAELKSKIKEQAYYSDDMPKPGTKVNSYLSDLYQTYEQEIRGENKPIEDCDNRPNYIGMCMHMMKTVQEKIGCLRKVRELTAMNPFYQYRIDRFVDAITDTYEPTDKPGFTEYIRGTKDGLHEHTLLYNEESKVQSYLDYLNELDPIAGRAALVAGGLTASIGIQTALKRKRCKSAYPNDEQKFKECMAGKG